MLVTYRTQHPALVTYLPVDAENIVEFGCGEGLLGQSYLGLNPTCQYVGFDCTKEPLFRARHRLSQVAYGRFGTIELTDHCLNDISCMVFHSSFMAEPNWQETLARHLMHLKEGGQAIFFMDNPAYVRRLSALMQGKSLDGSLSLKELQEALLSCSLSFDRLILQYDEPNSRITNDVTLQELGKTLERFCPQETASIFWTKRFILRAVKGQEPARTLIHTVIGEKITSRVRLEEPNTFLATIPGIDTHVSFRTEELVLDGSTHAKVLILQRLLFRDSPGARDLFIKARSQGYLLVYEIDDNPDIWEESFRLSRKIEFLGSHAVQVSTKPLVEYIRPFNPNVLLFENHLRELPPKRTYYRDEPVTLFFGALNRKEDWKPILPALNHVLTTFGSRVRVKVVWDEEFFRSIATENKEMVGSMNAPVPYQGYQQTLHGCDIALLPLRDTKINRMKSDLKFIEAGGHGVVALASPVVYAETIKDGQTGFLYHSLEEFVQLLSMLITNFERRMEIVEAAYAYVAKKRLLQSHYKERIEQYKRLMQNLPLLNRECDLRMQTIPPNVKKKQ